MDFDFSTKDKKWTAAEKREVIRLKEEGLPPAKIEKKTGVPRSLIKFWTKNPKKKRRSKKTENSYYRTAFNDWLSWKSNALTSSFNSRYSEQIEAGHAKPILLEDVKAWIVKVRKECHYCDIKLTEKNFGVDHAQPISRGGANEVQNLRQCCQSCNLIKGALTEDEYKTLREFCSNWEDNGKSLFARLKRGNKFF
jgi:5-methylcytosine-specific restriction endonuclease McrA